MAQLDILKESEWEKRPVAMQINARLLRGEITKAVLVSAEPIARQASASGDKARM
jgi:hypothetical protein